MLKMPNWKMPNWMVWVNPYPSPPMVLDPGDFRTVNAPFYQVFPTLDIWAVPPPDDLPYGCQVAGYWNPESHWQRHETHTYYYRLKAMKKLP
jgi:hypothetical protein